MRTNINGTCELLEAARALLAGADAGTRTDFRFLHVSTDEVYGSLGPEGAFTETTPYAPNSPYSASKAAADHLVRAYHETYGPPTLPPNCSKHHGPYHFPEKLVPPMLMNPPDGKPPPHHRTGQKRGRSVQQEGGQQGGGGVGVGQPARVGYQIAARRVEKVDREPAEDELQVVG